jgi:putative hydrolase of the HAD superfamily
MKYKAVVFDLFGTLVDNFPPGAFERVVSQMAATVLVPPTSFIQRWGEVFAERDTGLVGPVEASVEEVCRTLGGAAVAQGGGTLEAKASAERIKAASRLWVDLIQTVLTPRTDAAETLTQLKARGYKTGLVSNCGWDVPVLWEATSVTPLIDARVYSCAPHLTKPNPRIYQLVCEQLGMRPEDCLYVGDGSDLELTGAARTGMHPVLIRVPYENLDDPYHPDAKGWRGPVISALKDVLALLE